MKTDTVIRQEGIKVLIKELGNVDAERFIALMNREPFDYTKWRQDNLPEGDVRTISHQAMELAKTLD